MTARAEYSAEEWDLLRFTPYAAALAVAFSDGSGVIESLRESVAAVVAQAGGLQRYPDNELIGALLRDRTADGQGAIRDELEGVAPAQAAGRLLAGALDRCRRVAALLEDRSSQAERDGYLQWTMDVARAAALAVRHGGLFSRGSLADEQERAVLADLAEALGAQVGDLPA